MGVEDILKSNDIVFWARKTSWSKEESYWNDATKTYSIHILNKKLNINKEFDFSSHKDPSPEDVLVSWFNAIAASLSAWHEYVDYNGNIIMDPNDEYVKHFGESLKNEIKEIVSLKRDLEEVLGDCVPEMLSYMANSNRSDCRGYAAFFPVCPKEAIRKLMVDEDRWVREMAIKHPHAKDLMVFT